jgi:predicted nucleic acid-binding Zn ribbon protein
LQRVLQRIDPDQRMKAYRIWTFWRDEVGAAIAARAEPAGFRAGVLSVRVSSAAWMQELQFMKENIRERLNARLGENLVRDIYLVSGPVQAPKPDDAPAAQSASEHAVVPPIPRLKDPRLAAVFERIARAHARRPRGSR